MEYTYHHLRMYSAAFRVMTRPIFSGACAGPIPIPSLPQTVRSPSTVLTSLTPKSSHVAIMSVGDMSRLVILPASYPAGPLNAVYWKFNWVNPGARVGL